MERRQKLKTKKIMAFIICTVLLVGTLQACNLPNPGNPGQDEPVMQQPGDEPQWEEPNQERMPPPEESPPGEEPSFEEHPSPGEPPPDEPPPVEEPPQEPPAEPPASQAPPQQQQPNQQQSSANWTTDIAVTDIYPDNQPKGTLFVRITNNGPGTLKNVKVQVACSAKLTKADGSPGGNKMSDFTVKLNLSPGQTKAFSTQIKSDTAMYKYDAACQAQPGFNDPKPGNNTYQETL